MQFSFSKTTQKNIGDERRESAIDDYVKNKYAVKITPEEEARAAVQSIYDEFLKQLPASFERAS